MSSTKKIVIIGPAYPLRGGLAAFNERLAKELQTMGYEVLLYTFSLQYPSFLFPGKTQYSTSPPPEGLSIKVTINSVNPFNWLQAGWQIKKEEADLIICRYWLPFMAPCLGSILRMSRKKKHTEIVSILDNVIPHEKRPGDQAFTRYFIHSCDRFIAMSKSVMKDLQQFTRKKTVTFLPHPLYDNFGPRVEKEAARAHLKLSESDRVILFFGFIRKYKGLDLLLEAMSYLKDSGIKLLVAGEFYDEEKIYHEIIAKNDLSANVILQTDYIPDEEVKYYFCASDLVVQPYRSATQSGITPMAYHFEIPMLVTDVGGLPERVPDKKAGMVTQSNPKAIAEGIGRFYSYPQGYFLPFIREEKKKYSWSAMANAVLGKKF